MKKRIALLLAAVMTIAMLPVNAYAWAGSVAHVSKVLSNVPVGTILYEDGASDGFAPQLSVNGNAATSKRELAEQAVEYDINAAALPVTVSASPVPSTNPTGKRLGGYWGSTISTDTPSTTAQNALIESLISRLGDNIGYDYYIHGTDLVVNLDSNGQTVKVGDTFNVTLENAEWFFRSNNVGALYENNAGFGKGSLPRITTDSAIALETTGTASTADGLVPVGGHFADVAQHNYDVLEKIATPVNSRLLSTMKSFWTPNRRYAPFGFRVDATVDKATSTSVDDDYNVSGMWTVNSTYNPKKGIYFANKGDTYGDYYRFAANTSRTDTGTQTMEVPYVMMMTSETTAQITIMGTRYIQDRTGTITSNTQYGGFFTTNEWCYNKVEAAAESSTDTTKWTNASGLGLPIPADYNSTYRAMADEFDTENNDGSPKAVLPIKYEIRIPLVVATGEGVSKITINKDNVAGIIPSTISFSTQTAAAVKPSVDEIVVARDEFPLGEIRFTETRLNSIKYDPDNNVPGSVIVLEAPSGFTFKNNFASSDVKLYVTPGLAWKDDISFKYGDIPSKKYSLITSGAVGYYTDNYTYTNRPYDNPSAYTGNAQSLVNAMGVYLDSGSAVTNGWGVNYFYDNYNKKFNESRIVIFVSRNDLIHSTQIPGSLYITNLSLLAEQDAPMGDVTLKVINNDKYTYYNQLLGSYYGGKTNFATYLFPSDGDTFKVGERKEWDMKLSADKTPELVSGRYDRYDKKFTTAGNLVDLGGIGASEVHKTGTVTFEELSVNAWWTGRYVDFTLQNNGTKGAKFRKVQITTADNFADGYSDALKGTLYPSNRYEITPDKGVYLNDGEKHGYVTVDGNKITVNNLQSAANKLAVLKMDLWVSIESGYAAGGTPVDLKLRAEGSAIPDQVGTGLNYLECAIAKVIDPVKVEVAEVKDIKLGLQFQPTSDITITETKAGMLQRDKKLRVSISDLMSDDIVFTPDTTVAVTSGNLKIGNVMVNEPGQASSNYASDLLVRTAGTASGISCDITQASNTNPATITVSNVGLKVSNSVPQSIDYNYKAVAWGNAIAENYGTNRDQFQSPGIMATYIAVNKETDSFNGILSYEVRVPADQNYYVVAGKEVPYEDTNVKPYLSTASDSLMVPLRFVSYALGISEDNVIWDATERTATVITPYRAVQFKANSDRMTVDGVTTQMLNQANKAVMSEIKGDRMYIPFRMLGNAFGIAVEWDATTREAIYNKGMGVSSVANASVAAADVAETTAE